MKTEWNGIDGRSFFAEHNKQMKLFRKSHPSDWEVKVSRRDLINTMWPLLVADTLADTGGSSGLTSTEDWPTFVPLKEVMVRRLSAN